MKLSGIAILLALSGFGVHAFADDATPSDSTNTPPIEVYAGAKLGGRKN